MIFPPYIFPFLGNGMVIGLNAVIHVLISHGIAIGSMGMLALGESRFGRGEYAGWHDYNKALLKFNVFVITILGAVTGAGIWFTIMPLTPLGQSHMIRVFFWVWFFEYVVFFAEVIVLLMLYFRWDALLAGNRRDLAHLAWTYTTFAMISGISITMILGFMLTPGAWVKTHRLIDGMLNPSFLPQTAARFSFSFIIGALVSLAGVTRRGKDSFRAPVQRLFGKVLLFATLAFIVSLVAYLWVIPRAFAGHIPFAVLTSHFSRYPVLFSAGNIILFLLLFACAFAAVTGRQAALKALIIPAAVAVVLLVAQFERVREFIRGPYLMPGHMYANSILLDQVPFFRSEGLAGTSPWFRSVYPQDADGTGAFLYARNCAICHTVGGINDIAARLRGRPEDGIYVILGNTHVMVPFMPPFAGTDDERKTLAGFLYRVTQGQVKFRSVSRALPEVKGQK